MANHDPKKYDPKKDDPDYGKDLSNLVPHIAVAAPWNGQPGPPSFNSDPPPPKNGQGSGDPSWVPLVAPIAANLISFRTTEMSLIAKAQSLVADYETLREKVFATKDTVFGQQATEESFNDPGQASGGGGSGNSGHMGPSPIQEPAKEFANIINPLQERVLEQIANSLEIVGQFIAGLNKAGQAYGYVDRNAHFPEPGPSPVT
jgi:hypothetical protein